ncbi:MAG TPA: hypothetical protein ENN86_03825, partial [Desulfobacteraceae bacterium]|nr:hypothetical protein [Desulfobacteraceae bacterium]
MSPLPPRRSLQYSRYLVVGLGISGLWAARMLSRMGADVTVSETRLESELGTALCREIRDLGAVLETGGHREESFLNTEAIIISP